MTGNFPKGDMDAMPSLKSMTTHRGWIYGKERMCSCAQRTSGGTQRSRGASVTHQRVRMSTRTGSEAARAVRAASVSAS